MVNKTEKTERERVTECKMRKLCTEKCEAQTSRKGEMREREREESLK